MQDINSIEDAVKAAIDGEEVGEETEVEETEETTEETEEETTEEETSEEGEEETQTEEDEEDEEEEDTTPDYGLESEKIQEAVDLYKNLTGANSANIIKHIARQAGIELAEDYEVVDEEPTSTEETTSGSPDFEGILKAKLGDRFRFLASPIAEAFAEVNKANASNVEKVREDITLGEFKKECGNVIRQYSAENDIPDTLDNPVSKTINELTQRYKFTGSSVGEFKDYFAEMHDLALAKLGKSKPNKAENNSRRTKKIKRNLDSVEPESAGNTSITTRKAPPQEYTAEEAVKAALRGEDWNS